MDEDGTGVLTREQFSDMLAGVGIYLTAHEQERVKERSVIVWNGACGKNVVQPLLGHDQNPQLPTKKIWRDGEDNLQGTKSSD